MNLLQHIRSDRTEKKKKEPFDQTLFSKIGGLVKTYALESRFLTEMDNFPSELAGGTHPVSYRVQPKPRTKHSLFPLLTEDEYHVVSEIIKKADNPYIYFANSPEEILFCKPLFTCNPSIGMEILARCHFKTLFLVDLAKEKADDLAQQVGQIREKSDGISSGEQKCIDSLTAEMNSIKAFIADVEKTLAEA